MNNPHTRQIAFTLLVAGMLSCMLSTQAHAAAPVKAEPPPDSIMTQTKGDLAGLSTPTAYALLLVGLGLMESLSRKRGR
jgi:hypothetical protein